MLLTPRQPGLTKENGQEPRAADQVALYRYFTMTHPMKRSRPMSCTVFRADAMSVLPSSTQSSTASAERATGIPAGFDTTGSIAMIVWPDFHRSPLDFIQRMAD